MGGTIQTAIGASSAARGNITTALGAGAIANGDTAAAVGVRAQASGYDSIAVGTDATAGRSATGGSVNSASAVGVYSAAQGTGASAIGTGAFVFGNGSGSVAATNPKAPRITGVDKNDTIFSIVGGNENFAVGNRNLVGGTSSNNVALGNDIKLGASAASFEERTSTQNGVTTRYFVPTFSDQVAITNSVAIGQAALVGASDSVAIGARTVAKGVGSYAGGTIMAGLLKRRIPIYVRRFITLIPALIILGIGVDPTQALVVSQVFLSFGIPFVLVPLLRLTSDRTVMGDYVNSRLITVVLTAIVVVIAALNVGLIVLTLTG